MGKSVERLETSEVAAQIFDGATIALTGSGIFLEADELFAALETSFLTTGHPRDLTIIHALGIGDGHVTLTDEAGLVVAVAVLMRRAP